MPPSRLLLCLLFVPPSMAFAADGPPVRAVAPGELPVKAVTVFSDQARVVRSGELRLDHGPQRLELPRLPQSIAPDSVRVEATGAKVSHVEVHPVRLGELPKTEAEALIDRLTRLRDESNALQDQLGTVNEERAFLASIRPYADPVSKEGATPLLLNPVGWTASLAFFDSRDAALGTAQGDLTEKLQRKAEDLAHVEEEARQLLGATGEGPGYVVTAVVEGKDGTAKVSLTYLARGARWYPSYDVHYVPGQKSVDMSFSGLVSQNTGEDWSDAHLTLSTAVPTTVTALPQLAVWKIGDRERFIPTPHAGPQDGAPPPRPRQPALLQPLPEANNTRERLMAALSQGQEQTTSRNGSLEQRRRELSQRKSARASSDYAESYNAQIDSYPAPSAPPPPAMAPMPSEARMEADYATGGADEEVAERAVGRTVTMESARVTGGLGSASTPRAYLSFASPMGWSPPSFAGDLPASLAGGYDFAYESARPESIKTGAEGRRVPLFSGQYPAESWINILPALSHSAYLVAEVTNSGQTPWLRGHAHLFVGSDLVGDATVPTTAPGEKVTLPLGIDDAIRVERNVQTVSSERGLFSRLDVGGYEVTIELLNTRNSPVPLRVKDQIPLPRQSEVVIALDKTEPAPFKADREMKEDGALEWRLNLAGGAKQVIKFQYEVARPKNWKLWQTSQPGVSR